MKFCPVFKAYFVSMIASIFATLLVSSLLFFSSCSSSKVYQDPQYLSNQLAVFNMKLQSREDSDALKLISSEDQAEISENGFLKPQYNKLRTMNASILSSRGIKVDNNGKLVGLAQALSGSVNAGGGAGTLASELGINSEDMSTQDVSSENTPLNVAIEKVVAPVSDTLETKLENNTLTEDAPKDSL